MITEMLPLYCVIAISLLTLLVSIGIAWEIRRVDSHVLRILDGRAPGEEAYTRPVYPTLTPEDYVAQARAYWEERIRLEAIRREAPSPRARRPSVATTEAGIAQESDKTPLSPISPTTLRQIRDEHRGAMELPAYREAPAVGEDEDGAPAWTHESGTWRRG